MSLEQALRLAIQALNQIPNKPLNGPYRNTYQLIPELEKALREASGQ